SARLCPPIENLVLTVKSHQVEAAIKGVKHALSSSSKIFLLQNGMGTLEKVTQLLDGLVAAKNIYPGINTHGVYLKAGDSGSVQVVHAGEGEILFGNNYLKPQINNPAEEIASLQRLSLSIFWSDKIEHKLWLKLAINAVINPLTAIHNCLNGELLSSQRLANEMALLCSEITSLYRAMDLNISEKELTSEITRVIKNTAQNQSSMLQDIKSGKKTEIDEITGYLLEKANQFQITMKRHQRLYHNIKSMDY
ncbi:MAG: hypothetical protein DRQ47_09050, partial [Gammaproteobacteria bacterium]